MDSLKLKAARISKGLLQEDMSRLLKMSIKTYCNSENGKRVFDLNEISQMVNILDLDIYQVNEIFFDAKLTNCIIQNVS
jgi:DNA-binding XRE family transcriptional regulator